MHVTHRGNAKPGRSCSGRERERKSSAPGMLNRTGSEQASEENTWKQRRTEVGSNWRNGRRDDEERRKDVPRFLWRNLVTHGKIVNIRKKIILTAYNLLPGPLEVQIQEPRSKIVNIKNVYLLLYSLVFFSPKKEKKKKDKKNLLLKPHLCRVWPTVKGITRRRGLPQTCFW